MPSSSTQEYSRTVEPAFRISTSAFCCSLCILVPCFSSGQELDSLAGFEAGCCECGMWLLSCHRMASRKDLSHLSK